MALLFPLATAGWGWGWGWNWREEEAWVEGGGSEGKGKKEEPLRDGTGFGQEILEGPFPLRRRRRKGRRKRGGRCRLRRTAAYNSGSTP